MDTKSQERFDKIVRTEPAALSSGDIEFLKARRSYLTAPDAERYAKVLGDSPDAETDAPKEKGK